MWKIWANQIVAKGFQNLPKVLIAQSGHTGWDETRLTIFERSF